MREGGAAAGENPPLLRGAGFLLAMKSPRNEQFPLAATPSTGMILIIFLSGRSDVHKPVVECGLFIEVTRIAFKRVIPDE